MATKNKQSTRYFSNQHETSICKALDGRRQSNSGAGDFAKGDIIIDRADMLIEAKTCMKENESFSVKKLWFEKNKQEAFAVRKSNHAVCFNFGPDQPNYYIINEKLMKFLCDKLEEYYNE